MTREIAMEEFAFLALRTATGIDRRRFEKRFGVPLDSIYADAIAKLKRQSLLAEDAAGVRLTELGMKYGNMAFEEFLL